jgi:hypothetical protein
MIQMTDHENIYESEHPDWVFNRARKEYINRLTGECVDPSEFFAEIMRIHFPVAPASSRYRNVPTNEIWCEGRESLLQLKQTMVSGNKWDQLPNPNIEVGETDTGLRWYPTTVVISTRKDGEKVIAIQEGNEPREIAGAGCCHKMHPCGTIDFSEEHDPNQDMVMMIDSIISLIEYSLLSLQRIGRIPKWLVSGLAIFDFLIDGFRFIKRPVGHEGEGSGISDLLSLQKRLREENILLGNDLVNDQKRIANLECTIEALCCNEWRNELHIRNLTRALHQKRAIIKSLKERLYSNRSKRSKRNGSKR